jgi:hypothetical protein
MKVSYFGTARYRAPQALPPEWPVPSGAYDREAGAQAYLDITIALLGPIVPQSNPVRVAEELAMLDTLAQGRLVVGLLRGTTNEYLTYDLNPAEARERTDEGTWCSSTTPDTPSVPIDRRRSPRSWSISSNATRRSSSAARQR